mmetsp:Transcript_43489/g.113134  ORF Transcript_43489/g.113134 Transcript_43489/m.113134 type:complete len:232 (+) Transcript_43489:2321-3016(+)
MPRRARRDGGLPLLRCGLRDVRLDALGTLRQDVRGGPDRAGAAGGAVPGPGGQGVPAFPHRDEGVQQPGVRREGLRGQRLDGVEQVLRGVRRWFPEPLEDGLAPPEPRRRRLWRGASGVARLRRPAQLRGEGLRVGQLVRLERLLASLWWRPAGPRPPDRHAPQERRRGVPPRGRGGDAPVQPPRLPERHVPRRRVGPVGRLGPLLGVLRRRHDVPEPQGQEHGERMRQRA